MIARKTLALILLGFFLSRTEAQSKFMASPTETKDVSQKVAQLFKENKAQEAIAVLKPYWPLPETEIDLLEEKTVKGLNFVGERFGKAELAIKVSEQAIKDFAIRETYLVKYEKSAIRLMFVYFKNEKGWVLNSFKWDDNFSEEFK